MAGSRSKNAPGSKVPGNGADPGDYLREAASEYRLALRYARAAVTPAVGHGVQAVRDRVAASGGGPSLKERLDPTHTEKGGKVGDAADAMLAKMGMPGKLASKASLGSRLVDRLTPTALQAGDEAAPVEEQEPEELPEDEAAEDLEVEEDQEPEAEEDEDAEEEGEDEEPEAEEDEDTEEEGEDEEPAAGGDGPEPEANGDGGVEPVGPVVHREIPSEHEHAYSEELSDYEHQEAYDTTRS